MEDILEVSGRLFPMVICCVRMYLRVALLEKRP